ncbi:RHS repeat-associated core domain-containing protein [uncultured Maribacter sp.]|uniref:RHS repeat domain-containing protein n=1 Tax=uncultured Maribacter sp. TaxID=431308 RepID=UPI002625A117|nr:RHS repeat-associated core domain-containing protein [uncultured Maribacter sp.]
MHEWEYTLEDRPKLSVNAKGFVVSDAVEPVNLISWVFDYNSFVPAAKIVDGNTYSIACDHLGTPVQAYNQTGEKVWERQLDIYGATKYEEGETNFIPFLYQGQFLDSETGLAYNRFRYYSPDTGTYISQDPIGLSSGEPNSYAYVRDSNSWLDVFGLAPWPRGGFNNWFNNASPQDIIDNKKSVERALRNGGGLHEKFPVSTSPEMRNLGFTAEELKDATTPTKGLDFVDVYDPKTGELVSGSHHKSSASKLFHDDLIRKLKKAKTKMDAILLVQNKHDKHVKKHH